MTNAWTILLISAFTDFVITSGTAIGTAMVATQEIQMPSEPVILMALIGGIVQAARTIQQALKAAQSPESVTLLKRPTQ